MGRSAPDDAIERILEQTRTVAVVGLSPSPMRPSHAVARYLQRVGYRIVPVNPTEPEIHVEPPARQDIDAREVLGERAYPSLRAVPDAIDLVDVFRRAEHVPAIVEEAIAVGARAIWLQDGVVHETAAQRARSAGLAVVMDDCIMRRHAARARR